MVMKLLRVYVFLAFALMALQCSRLEYDHSVPEALKANPTIVDYFLFLPVAAFPEHNPRNETSPRFRETSERRVLLKVRGVSHSPGRSTNLAILDVQNGFMEFWWGGNGEAERLQIALWKRTGAPDIIGVAYGHDGTPVQYRTDAPRFYAFSSGEWSDETSAVFPGIKDGSECILPQVGTTITCRAIEPGDNASVRTGENAVFTWNRARFVREN